MIGAKINPYLILILAMVSWGLSNPLADLAVVNMSPILLSLIESLVGLFVIAIVITIRRIQIKLPWKFVIPLGLIQPGFAWLLGNIGYTKVTASTGVIFLNLESVFAIVIAALWIREQINTKEAIAIGIGLFGGLLASFDAAGINFDVTVGVLLFAFVALLDAIYAISIKKYGKDLDAIALGFGQILVSTVLMLLIMIIFDRTPDISQSLTTWLAALISGLFGVALPIVAFNWAGTRIKSTHVGLSFNIVPIVGFIGAIILGRGAPTQIQVVGAIFVVISIWLIQSGRESQEVA